MNAQDEARRLQDERARIGRRQQSRRKAADRDSRRLVEIEDRLRRLTLQELIGKPNAVQLRYRRAPGDKCARLNDLYGTLTEVRRTRATVDFGKGEIWNMPLDSLLPADAWQGFEFGASMRRPEGGTP
jgi:hypothetical protein